MKPNINRVVGVVRLLKTSLPAAAAIVFSVFLISCDDNDGGAKPPPEVVLEVTKCKGKITLDMSIDHSIINEVGGVPLHAYLVKVTVKCDGDAVDEAEFKYKGEWFNWTVAKTDKNGKATLSLDSEGDKTGTKIKVVIKGSNGKQTVEEKTILAAP